MEHMALSEQSRKPLTIAKPKEMDDTAAPKTQSTGTAGDVEILFMPSTSAVTVVEVEPRLA